MEHEIKYAAFFYVPASTGHGWGGDYLEVIRIFCKSAKNVGITPIHLTTVDYRIPEVQPFHVNVSILEDGLVLAREKAYLAFVESNLDLYTMLCDPDQVFVNPIPPIDRRKIARLVYRPNDLASYNGMRIVSTSFYSILDRTINRMEKMDRRHREWDGDSIAFADAVREYEQFDSMKIDKAPQELYFSRPNLGAPKDAYMYHFKGLRGKQEMLDYAKANGLS